MSPSAEDIRNRLQQALRAYLVQQVDEQSDNLASAAMAATATDSSAKELETIKLERDVAKQMNKGLEKELAKVKHRVAFLEHLLLKDGKAIPTSPPFTPVGSEPGEIVGPEELADMNRTLTPVSKRTRQESSDDSQTEKKKQKTAANGSATTKPAVDSTPVKAALESRIKKEAGPVDISGSQTRYNLTSASISPIDFPERLMRLENPTTGNGKLKILRGREREALRWCCPFKMVKEPCDCGMQGPCQAYESPCGCPREDRDCRDAHVRPSCKITMTSPRGTDACHYQEMCIFDHSLFEERKALWDTRFNPAHRNGLRLLEEKHYRRYENRRY